MSKSSRVTVRDTPAGAVSAPAAPAGFVVKGETLTVQSRDRVELLDLTDRVIELARQSGVRDGVINLWSMHTTCALFINEVQQALHADIKRFLEEVVSREADWMHNDPRHSDCDRMNADSHLRAMLLGHSLTLQIAGGEVVLGHWQRVLAAELDGPRPRTIRIQLMGR